MNAKPSILTKPVVVALLAILCTLLWGSAYPAIKIGYELFHVGSDDTAAKMAYAGLRFTLGGLLVLAIRPLMAAPEGIRNSYEASLEADLILALVQTTIHYTSLYRSLLHERLQGAIINASTVFFSALLAHFFHTDDRITLRKANRSRSGSAR